jgi:geranylgeranyl diphosphate synthase, type II
MNQIAVLQDRIELALTTLELPSEPRHLYEPITYTLSNGGKRMRPLLVLIGCKIFDGNIEEAIHPAIGIELFHNFTLLHDDIMDKAPLRRGMKTVHEKWNNHVAILSGDALFIRAYQELVQTNPKVLPSILGDFNRTALQICEGQQMDMDFETFEDVSIESYLKMIGLKTAVLLAASLKIGAVIGGASRVQAELMYDFGLNAGIAFQLQDDILDIYGESQKVGKQNGGDIISNKKTFLLLKTMELAKGETAKKLATALSSSDNAAKVNSVTAIYAELGIRELAEKRMWEYYNKGISSLEKVNADEKWLATLRAFSNKLMHRES